MLLVWRLHLPQHLLPWRLDAVEVAVFTGAVVASMAAAFMVAAFAANFAGVRGFTEWRNGGWGGRRFVGGYGGSYGGYGYDDYGPGIAGGLIAGSLLGAGLGYGYYGGYPG